MDSSSDGDSLPLANIEFFFKRFIDTSLDKYFDDDTDILVAETALFHYNSEA
jgi:hypothetical protein